MAIHRRGFSFIELIVVTTLIAILAGLLLSSLQSVREAARRCTCANNLHQIGLALHGYQATFECFPIGTADNGSLMAHLPHGYHHNWLIGLLPFAEQAPLSASINTSLSVYNPANSTARSTRLAHYQCPSDFRNADAVPPTSSYVGCNHDAEAPIRYGTNGLFVRNRSWRIEEIEDGTAQTIAVGEKLLASPDLGWMSGTSATLRNAGTIAGRVTPAIITGPFSSLDPRSLDFITTGSPATRILIVPGRDHPLLMVGGFESNHPGCFNALLADGSMRFIKTTVAFPTLAALANPRDFGLISRESY